MKIRLAGLVLIALGVLTAVFFVYQPFRGEAGAFSGLGWTKALVFIPLAIVTGLSFTLAGAPALEAFQARPKSRGQLAFVLGVIVGSAVLSGTGYWWIKTRWMVRPAPEIIRDFRGKPEFTTPRPVNP